jgi:hypothetical protein
MIHSNDVILLIGTDEEYVVTRVGSTDCQARSVADSTVYIYPSVNPSTLELVETNKWRVVQCPHTVTTPTTTDPGMTLAGWYAAQVGTMEVRLADIYFVTKRAQEAVAKSNAVGLNWQLDHIIEAIERTADKLASLTSPSSSDNSGWLQSRIYADRK